MLPYRSSTSRLKTQVINQTVNPTWNEELVLAGLSICDLAKNRAVELSLWDYNKKFGSSFIGGVRLGPSAPAIAKWMDCTGQEVTGFHF